MQIPAELRWLSWAVQPHWPDGDEAALRRCAGSWRDAAGALRAQLPDADRAGGRALGALQGPTADAARTRWDAYTVGDGGHVEVLATACTDLADLCDGTATMIEDVKHLLIGTLVRLAAELAVLAALAEVTAGLSLLGIAEAGAAAQRRAHDIGVRATGALGLAVARCPAGGRLAGLQDALRVPDLVSVPGPHRDQGGVPGDPGGIGHDPPPVAGVPSGPGGSGRGGSGPGGSGPGGSGPGGSGPGGQDGSPANGSGRPGAPALSGVGVPPGSGEGSQPVTDVVPGSVPGQLSPGALGPGQLGPGQLGPGQLGSGGGLAPGPGRDTVPVGGTGPVPVRDAVPGPVGDAVPAPVGDGVTGPVGDGSAAPGNPGAPPPPAGAPSAGAAPGGSGRSVAAGGDRLAVLAPDRGDGTPGLLFGPPPQAGQRERPPREAPRATPEPEPDVDELIEALLVRAAGAEERLTPVLEEVAREVGGELFGVEHRLKPAGSVRRKLDEELDDCPGSTVAEVLARMKDAVRYTVGLAAEDYDGGVERVRDALARAGYEPVRHWFWRDGEQLFEVQVHTAESYAARGGQARPRRETAGSR